jgi:dolichol-phosphate mannosyltransferase
LARYDTFVSVVAPLHNNGDILGEFVEDTLVMLRSAFSNYEILLVDDYSIDTTEKMIQSLLNEYECLRYLRLSREYGTEMAISAGLDLAIGDFTVVLMPNTDPPKEVPRLIEAARSGDDVLVGVQQDRGNDSVLVRMGASIFYWYCKKFLNISLPKNSTEFCVLSRQAVNAITQIKEKYQYLRIFSSRVGYRVEQFTYAPICRNGRNRVRKLGEAVRMALNVAISNSKHPLRFVTWLGVVASGINFLYGVYVVFVYLLKSHTAEGWTTTSLQGSVMFFFVFLILAIIAEYVGRIFDESKNRPLYYAFQEKNSTVQIANEQRRNIAT